MLITKAVMHPSNQKNIMGHIHKSCLQLVRLSSTPDRGGKINAGRFLYSRAQKVKLAVQSHSLKRSHAQLRIWALGKQPQYSKPDLAICPSMTDLYCRITSCYLYTKRTPSLQSKSWVAVSRGNYISHVSFNSSSPCCRFKNKCQRIIFFPAHQRTLWEGRTSCSAIGMSIWYDSSSALAYALLFSGQSEYHCT